jgi:hypothetical protein
MQDMTRIRRQIVFGLLGTRVLLGGLLLLAAGLKAFDLIDQRAGSVSTLTATPYASIVLIIVEIILASWLISGWRWRTARPLMIAWMSALSGISLHKAVSGATSCGCFGQLQVNPWITFSLDLVALLSLVAAPSRREGSLPPWRRWALACSQVLMLAPIVIVLFSPVRRPIPLPPGTVELEATKWLEEPSWSLGSRIDVWEKISKGKWAVLLYGSICKACLATMDSYEELARVWRSEAAEAHVAIIDTVGEFDLASHDRDCAALHGRMELEPDWYIATPTLVLLVNGRVVQVSQGYEECIWNDRKFP